MQEIWDLWMKGGVRKAQNIYYSKVRLALLSPVLKVQEKRKRRDPTTNATEQAQVRLDLRWQKEPLEAGRREGLVPTEIGVETQSAPEACKQMLAGPGYQSWITGQSKVQRETWDGHHLHVRHSSSFNSDLKKKKGGEKKFSKLSDCQAGVWNN